jgi:adenylate kinase
VWVVVLASISAIYRGISLPLCRDGYSMDPLLPKKEGICDNCGGKLIIRDDDKLNVIEERMK